MKLLFPLFFFLGCALSGKPKEGKAYYSYLDESGKFLLVRETRVIQQRIVSRVQLLQSRNSSKLLEKTILVSQIGSIKSKQNRLLTVRPQAADYEVWIEGKKYASSMRINPKGKSMRLSLDSPDPKWQGTSEVRFPKGKYFCFYSQIPECLYHNYLLRLARENEGESFSFFVVWDSYPYLQELLTNVGKTLFVSASVKFDGANSGLFRYIVEVEGQEILLQFSKAYDLEKVAWISQGITIAPPGQEIVEDE